MRVSVDLGTNLVPNVVLLTSFSLGSLQSLLQLHYMCPKFIFITSRVPSFTLMSKMMLLSLVVHPFRVSYTPLRSANVRWISTLPVFRMVIFPLSSLRLSFKPFCPRSRDHLKVGLRRWSLNVIGRNLLLASSVQRGEVGTLSSQGWLH